MVSHELAHKLILQEHTQEINLEILCRNFVPGLPQIREEGTINPWLYKSVQFILIGFTIDWRTDLVPRLGAQSRTSRAREFRTDVRPALVHACLLYGLTAERVVGIVPARGSYAVTVLAFRISAAHAPQLIGVAHVEGGCVRYGVEDPRDARLVAHRERGRLAPARLRRVSPARPEAVDKKGRLDHGSCVSEAERGCATGALRLRAGRVRRDQHAVVLPLR